MNDDRKTFTLQATEADPIKIFCRKCPHSVTLFQSLHNYHT